MVCITAYSSIEYCELILSREGYADMYQGGRGGGEVLS